MAYIDADALLENLKKQYGEDLGWQCTVNMSDVGMMIEDAPTADVVEVVRCRDCEHKQELSKWEKRTYVEGCVACERISPGSNRTIMCPDDFCSYGERRTE